MHFDIPLTLLQYLLPPVCAGLLISGVFLFTYLSVSYKSPVYTMATLLALIAICFVGSEVLLLSFGAYKHDWKTAIRFHQLEQLAGAFFLFGLPAYLGTLVDLDAKWRRRNRIVSYIGLAFALLCLASIVFNLDWFVSSSERKITWNTYEGDFGRGKEGFLYIMRDGLLTVSAVYSFISIRRAVREGMDPRYLRFTMAGIIVAILGGAIDTGFVYTGYHFDPFPHVYFSRFSLGITFFVLLLMAGLIRHYIDISKEVEVANRTISLSEKKYRVLVEGSNDLVFTLDDRLRFRSVNRAASRQFGMSEALLSEKSFLEMIHAEEGSKGVELELVSQKIAELDLKGRPVNFKVFLIGGNNTEPKEYDVRFEHITIDGSNEIIGKASLMAENTLMKYLDSESQRYEIDNYLITAEEVSKRLVANIGKHLTPTEVIQLRIGLREIIINAIEHGNLNISFDEKSTATMEDNYMEFIAQRQRDPRFRDRRVTVKFALSSERVVYVIEDEGNGFNYRSAMDKVKQANSHELAHGRGLMMAMGIFDKVKFNDRGNKVILLRKFKRGRESAAV